MRRMIVLEHISLDGVIQAPGRPDEDPSGGFAGAVRDLGRRIAEKIARIKRQTGPDLHVWGSGGLMQT